MWKPLASSIGTFWSDVLPKVTYTDLAKICWIQALMQLNKKAKWRILGSRNVWSDLLLILCSFGKTEDWVGRQRRVFYRLTRQKNCRSSEPVVKWERQNDSFVWWFLASVLLFYICVIRTTSIFNLACLGSSLQFSFFVCLCSASRGD